MTITLLITEGILSPNGEHEVDTWREMVEMPVLGFGP